MVQIERKIHVRNNAPESGNKIHSDDGARAMGFAKALVPGNAVYAHVEPVITGAFGEQWWQRGAAELRFMSPAYEGETIVVTATDALGRSGVVALTAVAESTGKTVAAGSAWLVNGDSPAPDASAHPLIPTPAEPVEFTEDYALDSSGLGSLQVTFDEDAITSYLDGIGADHAPYEGGVPSALLARSYAALMWGNVVRKGPSVHTSTAVRHYRRVERGETISVRGRIDRLYGRRGNRFYVLDMAYVAEDGSVVMTMEHSAIYRLRPTRKTADEASSPAAGAA
jgi:acyl-coenzyme A thioesterase PaaI-like protein